MKIIEADGGKLLAETTRGSGRINRKGGPLAGASVGSLPVKDGTMSRPFLAARARRGIPVEVIFVFRVNSTYGVLFRDLTMSVQGGKAKASELLEAAFKQSGIEFLPTARDVLTESTLFAGNVRDALRSEATVMDFVATGVLKGRGHAPDPYPHEILRRICTELLLAANEPTLRVKPGLSQVDEEADKLLAELDDLGDWGLDLD